MLSANEIKEEIRAMGADLVGVADAESPLFQEHGEKPEELMPGVKSFISFAVSLNREAVCSGNLQLNRYDTMCVYERINHISLETIRLLGKEGARAVSVPPYLPVDMGSEWKGMKGEINHKTVAAIAGLGGIGMNRLLVTPQFGPFVRLGTVLTDASLSFDQPLDKNPCDDCHACKEACPADAIQEDGTLEYRACASEMMQSGLPGIISTIRKMTGADEKAVKSIVYNPDFWDMWQAAVSGIFYACSECIASCPVGTD